VARPYTKRRSAWAHRVMAKYFPDWPTWDEQVPLYDFRGWDLRTVESVGPMAFTRLMPRADLIAVKPDALLILEFDNEMRVLNIAKLDRYIDAVRNDYLRPKWRELRIQGVYVTPGYDGRLEEECKRKGYRYIVEPEI